MEGLKQVFFFFFLAVIMVVLVAHNVFAAWTPLINSTDFTGIMVDVGATAVGIISVILVVLGLGVLVRVLGR